MYVMHKPPGDLVHLVFSATDLRAAAPWAGMLFAAVLVAAAVLLERVYDIPVRRFLSRRLRSAPARS
jgi:peptidoglycan/LPS O-acetylase OafA/YrhL